ncbi:MAG: hypothetical protein L0Y71_07850 [Gemmataceae bacterium]|nr:hypothetical protein [Gemmataceae bacterium]
MPKKSPDHPLINSREYKFMLRAGPFVEPADGLKNLWDEVGALAESLGLRAKGEFDAKAPKERTITFFDTPDHTLRLNGFVLRKRVKQGNGKVEYTLKCRSPDRYLAAGAELAAAGGFKEDRKFEEDVGTPFVSRFSHSNTIDFKDEDKAPFSGAPRRLKDAARLFPALGRLRRDAAIVPGDTPLAAVNGIEAYERVYQGPSLIFGKDSRRSVDASVVVILWTHGKKGRLWAAEFSFRYENGDEDFPAHAAGAAKGYFEALQAADWADRHSQTKTQLIYLE